MHPYSFFCIIVVTLLSLKCIILYNHKQQLRYRLRNLIQDCIVSLTNVRTSTQACSYCIVTDGPSPLNSSWDLVGTGCCQGLWGEEEGEGRSGRGSFVGRLKEKERTSTWQLHVETFTLIIISISSIRLSS